MNINNKLVEGKVLQILNNKLAKLCTKIIQQLNRKTNQLFKKIDDLIAIIPRKRLSKKTPVQKNKIMFITYQGDFTCNPRGIAEEIIRQKLPYKLVWVVKKETDPTTFPSKVKLVLRGSYEFYKEAASAALFIDNTHDLPRLGVKKKENQILLQTWHGSLGIKRLDGDIVMNRRWKKLAKVCQQETDFCISNSSFENDVFETSYWKGVPTLDYGHARNDILFTKDPIKLYKIRKHVFDALELDIHSNTKILLYAPTHKDNVNESFFDLDFEGIKKSLEERFGGNWVIALRFHSRLKKQYRKWLKKLPSFVVDATDYNDIQELMIVTDIGVTDYSSWIFDYILLKRPAFILADDIDTYAQNRSFYYPLESTPFPIATNNQELSDNIKSFDSQKYAHEVDMFLKARGCIEDGHASQRIVEKIKTML